MQNGTVNGILFIIGMFLMGSVGVFFPRWFQRRLEASSGSSNYTGFVGKYYSGPYSVFKLRLVGFFMYALGGFLFYWKFLR